MAIKLSNPDTRPAIDLDGLHVDQITLRIDRDTGKKTLHAVGVTYGIDSGDNIYSDNVVQVNEENFDTKAVTHAITNGLATDPADFVAKIAAAKAAMESTPPTLFEAMAQFEYATGMIFVIGADLDMDKIA